jgi:hypothetical protein
MSSEKRKREKTKKEKPEKPTSQRELAALNRIKEEKGFKFVETAKIYKAIDDYLHTCGEYDLSGSYKVEDIVKIFDHIVQADRIPNPEYYQSGVTVENILDELEHATCICGQDDIYDALYEKYMER